MSSRRGPRVAVVGGSYAAVRALRELRRCLPDAQLQLIAQSTSFEPRWLLPELLTGRLTHKQLRFSLTKLCRSLDARLIKGRVSRISDGRIHLAGGRVLACDAMLLAPDREPAFPKAPGVKGHAHACADASAIEHLGHHITHLFRRIRRQSSPERKSALTFVVAGSGVHAVELVAGIASLVRRHCERVRLDSSAAYVYLFTQASSVAPLLDPEPRQVLLEALEDREVTLLFTIGVERATERYVRLDNHAEIFTKTFVWAVLVPPAWVGKGFVLDGGGAISVDATLRCIGKERIFAAGECASRTDDAHRELSVREQERAAAIAARNLAAQIIGGPLRAAPRARLWRSVALGERAAVLTPRGGWRGRFAAVVRRIACRLHLVRLNRIFPP